MAHESSTCGSPGAHQILGPEALNVPSECCNGGKVKAIRAGETRNANWKELSSASYYSAPAEPIAWEELKNNLDR